MALGGIAAGYPGVTDGYPVCRTVSKPAVDQNGDAWSDSIEGQGSSDGKNIGFAALSAGENGRCYELYAQYASDSTERDPVVTVQVNHGQESLTYQIHINKVNPRNATQLEMFALLSYADDQGMSDSGSSGSYQSLMAYAENAKLNGYWEGNAEYKDICNQSCDWQQIIIDMWEDYSDAGLYSQKLRCMDLNSTMERFSIRFVDFENITFSVRQEGTSLHSSIPELPQEVMRAWYEALNESQIDDNEMLNYLTERMMQRITKWYESEGNEAVSGKYALVQAAGKAAGDALRALAYPLTPNILQTPEVQEECRQEKELYEIFIHKLTLQNQSVDNTEEQTNEEDYYEQLRKYKEKLLATLSSGDTEVYYQIGGKAYSEQEWDKLLERFDSAEDTLKKLLKEEELRMIALDKKEIRCGRPGQDVYEWECVFSDETQYERALRILESGQIRELLTI